MPAHLPLCAPVSGNSLREDNVPTSPSSKPTRTQTVSVQTLQVPTGRTQTEGKLALLCPWPPQSPLLGPPRFWPLTPGWPCSAQDSAPISTSCLGEGVCLWLPAPPHADDSHCTSRGPPQSCHHRNCIPATQATGRSPHTSPLSTRSPFHPPTFRSLLSTHPPIPALFSVLPQAPGSPTSLLAGSTDQRAPWETLAPTLLCSNPSTFPAHSA